MKTFRQILNEIAAERERVVKDRRAISKLTPPPGRRMQGSKTINMTAAEKAGKQRAGVKGARTRKAASRSIGIKRANSMQVRKRLGL